MVLKNNSTKIIGILETSILPNQTEECPAGYENNPVIKKYIKDGVLSVVKEDEKESKDVSVNHDEAKSTENTDGEKNLEDMSEEELIRYAAERNIDLGKASSKEGILKKIQEAAKVE